MIFKISIIVQTSERTSKENNHVKKETTSY